MSKRLLVLFTTFCLGVGLASGQTRNVSGTVVSADDGQPVVGASVVVEGTNQGAQTDVNGKFTLSLPTGGAKLRVSYIGMKTQVVTSKDGITIRLQDDNATLGEVVVTAMGITKEKKALGYAVQDVKADELTLAANPSLSGALQGKVSGIDIVSSSGMPGASAKITIRGSRSFTGDNTPLYVVDGMPIASTSDISTGQSVTGSDYATRSLDIDPNDIESVNVLKGQAASALYGMRASNGVIVITTKSGRGARRGKPEVTFTSNLSFDVVSVLPELQTTYAQGAGGAYSPKASTSWGPKITDLPNDATYGGNVDNAYTKKYGMHSGQYYVPQRAAAGLDPWATPQVYNNADEFFKTGHTWSNNVNLAQSNDRGFYSFSLGSTSAKGIVPSTGMSRYNAKLGAETKLSDHFKTGFNGNFVYTKVSKQSSANEGVVATVYGAPPSYDLAGIPSYVEGDPYTQNTYRSTNGLEGAYWAVANNKFDERSHRFFGNSFLNYTTKFGTDNHKLDVKYQLGVDAYTTAYGDLYGYGHSNGKGSVSNYSYTSVELNSLLTANYDWKINDNWDFTALLGNEVVDRSTKYIYSNGSNFNFGGWNNVANATVFTGEDQQLRSRTVGVFANLSASYKNMLYLNVTGRNDVVSTMPRNNRSFFYPSASVGFVFTELPLFREFKALSFGKLRASYAEVGQAGQYYPYSYVVPVYGGGFSSGTPIQYPIGGVSAYVPDSRLYDEHLRPQNTRSYELGVDLNFFNNRLGVSYTYSRQNVKDQIFPVPLASSTGYSEFMTNGGKIHTNSHEVTLTATPVESRNFKWDLGVNFTKVDNYVDALAPGVTSIFLGGFVDPQIRAGIGEKFPVIYGTSFKRNEAGQIVVDENGMPIAGPEAVLGSVSPDFRVGFNTSFELYKFRISAVFDWKQGGDMYVGTLSVLDYYGVSKKSQELRESESFLFDRPAVKQNADGTYSPNDIRIPGSKAFTYIQTIDPISENGVHSTSFVKLRELSVSYPLVNKPWLNLTVNAFARNLLLWSELKGFDPESSQGNTNMAGAFERFSLPGTSSYGFGFTLKF